MSPGKENHQGKRSRVNNLNSVPIDYDSVEFLRCHSKKYVDVDKYSSVWKCAFQPPTDSSNSLFATCGGDSVCVINAEDGSVKTKFFSKDLDEDFTALAWTTVSTIDKSFSFLAFAGRKFVLYMLHPEDKVCFAAHRLSQKSLLGDITEFRSILCIESLMFHPEQSNILFVVFTDGSVHILDIGNPHPPQYSSDLKLLQTLPTRRGCSANALAFSTHNNMLLCGTQEGVAGWFLSDSSFPKEQKYKQHYFIFPSTNENLASEDKNYVDSIEVFRDGKLIATKCALHGCIYIWDLEKALQSTGESHTSLQVKKTNPVMVTPLHTLKWSDTDNFYMIIGINQGGNILACGDDKGNVWVYDLDEILGSSSQEHDCSKIIEWPYVEDERALKKKMLVSYGNTDIVVNQVSLNYDATYLVAVTSTNTVCIWKRVYRN